MESSPELRTVPRPQVALLLLAALVASLMIVAQPLAPLPGLSGAGGAEGRAVEGYGNLPISFEPNVGQAPGRYDFVARGQGFGMAINATGATLALGTKEAQNLVRMNLVGADRSSHPRALEPLPGVVNYFIGNDPSKWRSDVSTFGRVSYREILPGIDVTYYGTNAGTLEYDFVVAPGADPTDIRVKFSGASDVSLRDGSLVIATANGAVTQEAPVLYQSIGGRRVPVDGRFSLAGDEVGFDVGAYDHQHPLVIDPTLVYSTYLGGSGYDNVYGIAVDGSGAAYVSGYTLSTNFPTQSPVQGSSAGTPDTFVAKLNATGSGLVYSTYLGGSGTDLGFGIAVDGSGAAHVTGSTTSTNFPTQSPFQGSNAGSTDAFVTKLNTAGSALVYSTYLGGSNSDNGSGDNSGIAVDGSGAAYVTGGTFSTNFPTQAAFQGSNAGSIDAFVTKLNAAGTALVYSTYLGGSGPDQGYGIAVDGSGVAYVAGITVSTNFPTQTPFQGTFAGNSDAFVTTLTATGSALICSTYLGGSNGDVGRAIAVDGSSAAYVAGGTVSTNFPTTVSPGPAPFQGSKAGSDDAFVTKLCRETSADLSLVKSDSTDPIAAGQTLTYTLTVQNAGPDTATGVTITDILPAGVGFVSASAGCTEVSGTVTCTVASIASGASAQVQIQVTPNQVGTITNTASVAANEADPQTADNQDSEQTTVQAPATCGGQAVTIQVTAPNQTTSGTSAADVINGTSGIDTIYGLGGNDTICGLGGNDKLHGGDDDDRLFGGDDGDILWGNVGEDKLFGAGGLDELWGNIGDDKLFGGNGMDGLEGGAGDDILKGNDGNDASLIGGSGNDNLFAGAGNDWLFGDAGNDNLFGGGDNDKLSGGDDSDVCDGGPGSNLDIGTPPCETSTNIP